MRSSFKSYSLNNLTKDGILSNSKNILNEEMIVNHLIKNYIQPVDIFMIEQNVKIIIRLI